MLEDWNMFLNNLEQNKMSFDQPISNGIEVKITNEEKNDPLLNNSVPKLQHNPPQEDAGNVYDIGNVITYFPVTYKNSIQGSSIIAPYNIIVAGVFKGEDSSFILNIKKYEDGRSSERITENYLGIKNITFTKLTDGNLVALFTFNDNQEGYFDIESGKAFFQNSLVKNNARIFTIEYIDLEM